MGLERGTVIGRIGGPGQGPYQLLEPVGAGRDTEVWRAESLRSGQIVAVKAYPRWYGGDRGYVQRFLRTAEASRQAQHPNLLPLLEAGEDDGHTFRVTPLVMGGSLEERLDGRPWSLTEALVVLEPLAAALDLLHGRGVVHGNVKPSNVLLDESERADAAAGRAASSLRRIGRSADRPSGCGKHRTRSV
jgi:serine/threonine kinase PknH